MKVICIERCFYSQGLKRFEEDKEYNLDQSQLNEILDAGMGKYFADELGESLADRKSESTETAKKAPATGEHKGK